MLLLLHLSIQQSTWGDIEDNIYFRRSPHLIHSRIHSILPKVSSKKLKQWILINGLARIRLYNPIYLWKIFKQWLFCVEVFSIEYSIKFNFQILKQGSTASLDAFAQEKQNFDEEQLKLIQKILDNVSSIKKKWGFYVKLSS